MNSDQAMVLIRTGMTALGPLLVAWGWVPQTNLAGFETAAVTAIGGVLLFGSMAWGLWKQAHASKVADANKLLTSGAASVANDNGQHVIVSNIAKAA